MKLGHWRKDHKGCAALEIYADALLRILYTCHTETGFD